jgi:uracil-DNA glycosylase
VQATSEHAGDGQRLVGARMVATVRCAPPLNKPTTAERDTCQPWIRQEIRLVEPWLRVVVALGSFGWTGALDALAAAGYAVPRPRPKFGHGASAVLTGPTERGAREVMLLGSYHPSQQNTFTGKLTAAMLDDVLAHAAELGRT